MDLHNYLYAVNQSIGELRNTSDFRDLSSLASQSKSLFQHFILRVKDEIDKSDSTLDSRLRFKSFFDRLFAEYSQIIDNLVYSIKLGLPNDFCCSVHTFQLDLPSDLIDYFSSVIAYLSQNQNTTPEDSLFVNVGVGSQPSESLKNYLTTSADFHLNFLPPAFSDFSIGGQVKLHPPGCRGSGIWHLDGDPKIVKCLLYLEDLQDPLDGCFKYLENTGSILSELSPFENILILRESTSLLWAFQSFISPELLQLIQSLFSVHNPQLCNTYPDFAFKESMFIKPSIVNAPVSKFKMLVFRGTQTIHAGGQQLFERRPVFQGIINPS